MRKNASLNNQDILNWYKTPDEMQFTSQGYPILEPCENIEENLQILPFNYAMSYKEDRKSKYIHFYIQDYLFNRIWNDPMRYIEVLKQYKGIVMPDFSLYYDMPLPLQQFNHYRNLWFARMCQIDGMQVIPSVNWSDKRSYDFCFEGLPTNSTIMLSTVGSVRRNDARDNFYEGVDKMVYKLNPQKILLRTTENLYKQFKNEWNYQNLVFVNCKQLKEGGKNDRSKK